MKAFSDFWKAKRQTSVMKCCRELAKIKYEKRSLLTFIQERIEQYFCWKLAQILACLVTLSPARQKSLEEVYAATKIIKIHYVVVNLASCLAYLQWKICTHLVFHLVFAFRLCELFPNSWLSRTFITYSSNGSDNQVCYEHLQPFTV